MIVEGFSGRLPVEGFAWSAFECGIDGTKVIDAMFDDLVRATLPRIAQVN